MNEELKEIKGLCSNLLESKIEIKGNKYDEKDLILIALEYDDKVITLSDALKVIKTSGLFNEIKRRFIDKDPTVFTNKTDYDKVKKDYTIKK